MVDSNGRVVELQDDAMLPPTTAGAAPATDGPATVDAPPLQEVGNKNGTATGHVPTPVAGGEMHERRK